MIFQSCFLQENGKAEDNSAHSSGGKTHVSRVNGVRAVRGRGCCAEVASPPLEPVSVAVLLLPDAAGVASSSPYLEVMEAMALLSVGSAKTAEET